jgi:hypothetical protein
MPGYDSRHHGIDQWRAFFSYKWVDDHIMVEPDTPGRLIAAEVCLRLAMMAVLSPRAINVTKFSSWSTNIEVLALNSTRLRER